MVEGDEFIGIDIRIGFLFKREVDIDTYGLTISRFAPLFAASIIPGPPPVITRIRSP